MRNQEFSRRLLAKLDKLDARTVREKTRELLEEQAFLERVLTSLREGVLVVGEGQDVLYVNPAAADLLGIPPSGALPGRIQDLVALLSDEPVLERFVANALANRDASFAEIVDLLHPRPLTVSVAARPIRRPGAREEVSATLILLDNRTRERNETLALSQLEKIEALMNLASAVAHELGNPLNAIMIHLRLLEDAIRESSGAKQRKFLAIVETLLAETRRLDAIVKHFLGATRRKPKPFRDANLQDVVEGVCEVLGPEMKRANVRLTLRLSRRIPPFLMDPERIHEALSNLLRNALQAMPRGGRLVVTTDRKRDAALIAVEDEGLGILEHDIPRLFEGAFTTKLGGSGLGLLITHGIVREHGGRIHVASRKGGGSTFTVELPIRMGTLQLGWDKKLKQGGRK